jgi:hypothetical protein
MVIETDMAGIMWDHPTVGQLLAIGLSLACCIYIKETGTGTNFNESWKYTTTLPIDLREIWRHFG